MNENIVIRYTPPTKFDDGLYGQICRAEGDGGHRYYIQVSKTKGENKWITMGDFLESIFRYKFNDEAWITERLQELD